MSDSIRCELITWNRFYTLARELAFKILPSGFQPDIIIAITRGGLIPARVLSDFLNIMNMSSFKIVHYKGMHKESIARIQYPLSRKVHGKNVLIVDDISDTGDTLVIAIDHVRQQLGPAAIKTAVLHHKKISRIEPDFYAQKVVKWRWIIYPWAVVEDITSMLKAIGHPPETVDEARKHLLEEYKVRVPKKIVHDVLKIMRTNN